VSFLFLLFFVLYTFFCLTKLIIPPETSNLAKQMIWTPYLQVGKLNGMVPSAVSNTGYRLGAAKQIIVF